MFDVERSQTDVIGLPKTLMPADSTDLKKDRSIAGMGDVIAHRKYAVIERLRKRMQRYRDHHSSCQRSYYTQWNGLTEQHKQDTFTLRQRYLETKAKKGSKKSEPKNKTGLTTGGGGAGGDSSSAGGGGSGGGNSNIGSGSVTSANNAGSVGNSGGGGAGGGAGAATAALNSSTTLNGTKYKRTAEESSSASGGNSNEVSSSGANNSKKSNPTQFSLEIQFSSSDQQIQTNVKVTTVASSSIKTSGSPAPSVTGGSIVSNKNSSAVTSTTVVDSAKGGNDKNVTASAEETHDVNNKVRYPIECKQEPELDLNTCSVPQDCSVNGTPPNFTDSLNHYEFSEEELKYLEGLTSEDMNLINIGATMEPPSDLTNLENNVDPFRSDQRMTEKPGMDTDSLLSTRENQLPPYPVTNPNSTIPRFPVSSSPSESISMNNGGGRPPAYYAQTSLGLDFLPKDSNPAAQKLKHLAEQHQQQHQQRQLGNIGLNTNSLFAADFNQFPGVTSDFLSSSADSAAAYFLTNSGNGALFPFESNTIAPSPTAGNKTGGDGLFRSSPKFPLHTSRLQEPSSKVGPMNSVRNTDAKNMPAGAGGAGGATGGGMVGGHCSPDVNSSVGPSGSPLSFVGTKPLSHFGETGQPNTVTSNATNARQYMRNASAPPPRGTQVSSAASPASNVSVPANLRQRHHYMRMTSAQNGHHMQVSQGPHSNVSSEQQPNPMFNYNQSSPQLTSSASGDHFQMSLNQSQAVTFSAAGGGASLPPNERVVSVNQTTVVQMSQGGGGNNGAAGAGIGPTLNMMSHHSHLLRPTSMQNQPDQASTIMQMQMDKRKLNQPQQIRDVHSGMTQFGVRPPPPDYGAQMNVMGTQQQQQGTSVLMSGVMTNQSGQMLINNSINNRVGSGAAQPRLTTAPGVLNNGGGRMMNGRSVQQMNFGSMGLVSAGVGRTNLGMPGRMTSFIDDEPRPPNVDIGPDGLNIGMRSNAGGGAGNAQDWRQRINSHNQHSSAKFSNPNLGVNQSPKFSGQMLQSDNMQMLSLQQQQQLNMINRIGNSGVNNCQSSTTHHHQQMQQHHQQMSTLMPSQNLMTQMSPSVVASSGAANFLSTDASSSGDLCEFFESGFGEMLNSFDMENGNSGGNLL